jgi:predicted PurR-regulated permease PerM
METVIMLSYFQSYKKILAFIVYFVFALLFWPFKTPLLFSVLFAFALHPLIQKIKMKFPKFKKQKILVASLLTGILAIFCVPVFVLIFNGISQINKIETGDLSQLPIYQKFESVIRAVNGWIQSLSSQLGVDISSYFDLNVIVSKVSQVVLPALTSMITQLPSVIVNFFIFIVSLYLILTKADYFKNWFHRLNLFSEMQIDQLAHLIQRVCNLVLISTVIVATAQALVISIACLFAGYTDFMILFMVVFFMSFVPVIGSAPLSVVLIIFSFMNGHIAGGIILCVAAVIAASIDNIIKTYMLTGEGSAGTHPFVSLLALVGSLSLFGFSGLFLGPIICELAFQIGGILFSEQRDDVPNNT